MIKNESSGLLLNMRIHMMHFLLAEELTMLFA